ncbi:FtsX-like permease family protein [Nocardiopsis sp. HNM0947]|uniref:FtsX-like permease family protein n=1 Tax=Nocardiopsis coralli TaxID=2772213 RepID=A0ABR9PB59_9ACTN|nr:FtsX-like permease family protein [Nocardiopsis coralli]MBE3001073.1 FtsX-like permease family protein [Nocardiopsis coralli]
MLRTTLAGLRLHTSRYVTTALAILLGVMFVTGTMVFADTLESDYESSVMGSATSVDAIAEPEEPEFDPEAGPPPPAVFGEEDLQRVRDLDEVADADGRVEGQAVLLDSDGRAFGMTPPAALSLGEVSRFGASEGTLPSGGDEIALATSTAGESGFGVGDTVTVLDPDQEEREFTVTGLVELGIDPSYTMGGAMVLDRAAAEEMTGAAGYVEIDALAAEGHTDEEAADAMAAVLGGGSDVRTGEQFGLDMAQEAGADTAMMRVALLLFAFIAMFVAAIVIYNTFAIVIAQRQREMALLRCVGAKRSQVFGSVLAESTVVGLVSSVLGVLAGIGVGMLGARFGSGLLGSGAGGPVDLVLTPAAVLSGLAVGTVVTVVSALIPALRATRVSPLAALRTSSTSAGLDKRTGWLRTAAGLAAFAASALMVWLSLMGETTETGMMIVTVAALTAFVGVVVLGPLLVRGIVHVAGLVLRRTGVASMLAVDNSTRNPKRAATAMIALTVGATLITGYSVVSASTESTMNAVFEEQFPVDYQLSPQFAMDEPTGGEPAEEAADEDGSGTDVPETETVPEGVRSALASAPEIDQVMGQRTDFIDGEGSADGSGMPMSLMVSAYTDTDLATDMPSELVSGDLEDMGPGRVALSEDYADGLTAGDTFTLPAEDGAIDLEVAAVTEEAGQIHGVVLDPQDFDQAFPGRTGDDMLYVRGAPGADPSELRTAVHDAVDDHPTVQVASMAEMKNQFSEVLDIAFYTIAAMLALAILIAVFGISNTMALSVLERTRESALLRALGLSRAQLRRMLGVEAVLLCLIGALIGITLGVVFGWAGAASVLPDLILTVPFAQIGVFVAIAVVAGLLASIMPARRAARTSITGSLAGE